MGSHTYAGGLAGRQICCLMCSDSPVLRYYFKASIQALGMARFVPLTREAYRRLCEEKEEDESFSDAIIRLITDTQKEYRKILFEPVNALEKRISTLQNRPRDHIRRW